MDAVETPPPEPTTKKRSILATLRGLLFTLMVLAAVWLGMRYVLTPIMMGQPHSDEQTTDSADVNRLDALEARIAKLETEKPQTVDLAPLIARIEALESAPKPEVTHGASQTELEALKSEIEKIKEGQSRESRSIMLQYALKEALASGRPFAAIKDALVAQSTGWIEKLAPVSSFAATGVPTLDSLKTQFKSAITTALHPQAEEKSLVANLKSLVKIRKVGSEQKGADDDAVVARAEAKLNAGDVAAALAELQSLTPAALEAFGAWSERAAAYLAAQALVSSSLEGSAP